MTTALPAPGTPVLIIGGVYRDACGTLERVDHDDLGGVVVVRTAPDTLTHVEPEEIVAAPAAEDVAAWHGLIAAAPTFAHAQERMELALRAGVDFFALRAMQEGTR